MCVLGDDNIGLMNSQPDTSQLRRQIRAKYNMESKDTINKDFGTCCQLVYYKLPNNRCGCGPDYVRLRHRF